MRERSKTKKRSMITLFRVIIAGGLILSLLLYFTVPAAHRAVSGWMMAYTQRSVQSVAGAMLQAGVLAPLKAVWLCALQTLVLPWLVPYSVGGSVVAFGPVAGGVISLLGALIGASAWFGMIRLFLKDIMQRLWVPRLRLHTPTGFCLAVAANLLTQGMLCIPAVASGASRTSFCGFLFSAFIAELPIVVLIAVYCGPYRALLPNPVEALLRSLGILLLLAGAIVEVYLRKKICASSGSAVSRKEKIDRRPATREYEVDR
jgi:uncharacterized membrane protein YdjX (TVP38/TMEM64 family)